MDAARSSNKSSADAASSATEELNKRLQEFVAYIGDYDHSQEQAIALLQLAVKTAEPGSAKKSARLEWPNVYAAIATLARTDSQTLHARLTIGFSPAEFKWMLQNKAVYTWHSNPVRFQRCLQCMVAKLGQCGSNAEKTCWSCRSRLTDAPPGALPSSGNALRPPRHIALTMAKTDAKQPIGVPEPDAHISMYEQSKWPLTKRDQTYLSQANKFWSFISTDAFLGITDRRQLLDLTDRACTKRYILYMHKMNKRENVRAAVDLHCLGLTYPQLIAANAAQSSAAPESELSHEAAAFAAAMSSLPPEPCQIHGPEAAGHLVPGTLAGQQVSAEAALLRHVRESPSETASTRRSARLQSALGAAEEVAEIGQSPSAGEHDWVNPSEDLLATLRGELDLDLRDAPDDSDEGVSRGGTTAGPVKKCRPWHWLKEMRQFGYERQVMPKDQKKKRKQTGLSGTDMCAAAATSSQAAPLALLRRQSSRRRAQQRQQPSADSESSNEDSAAAGQDDSAEEEDGPPEPKRRQTSFNVVARRSMLSNVHLLDPTQDPDPSANPSNNPSKLLDRSRSDVPIRGQQGLSSAARPEGLVLGSGLSFGSLTPGDIPVLSRPRLRDPILGLDHAHSRTVQANQVDRIGARTTPSGPTAANLPFPLPFTSSTGSSSAASLRSPFGLDRDLAPAQTSLQAAGGSLQQHYFPVASSALGGSLLTHAASSGDPHPRQHWPQLNQRGHNPFGLPPPHHSSAQPTGLHLGLNQGAQPPANSLFHASQDSQPRSSMFDCAQPAHEHDEFLIGQLEQHYLTQLQSSGSPQDLSSDGVVNTHGAAGGIPLRGGSWESGHMNRQAPFLPNPLGFMNAEQQQLLQHQQRHFSSNNPSSSVVYDVAEYEPISQGGMNLDQLSALMQAERSQALPALQSQQPLSFAQSYLTSLRMISPFSSAVSAPPVASNSYPLHGELFQNQGSVYSSWERMQRPVQSVQHSLEHAQPSTAKAQAAQGRGLLQYCEPSSQDDQDLLFRRHHES